VIRRSGADRVLAFAAVWVLPVAGVLLLSWRAASLKPEGGLDASWRAGLAMAAHLGVTFGNHLAFTYGPLGFLTVNQAWYGDLAQMAFIYLILVRLLLAIAIYAGARRSFGAVWGFVIAVFVSALSEDLLDIAALIAAVYLVQAQPGLRVRLLVMAIAGALTAFELLIKISVGLELAVMTLILTFAFEGSWIRHASFGALGFVAVLLAGWTLAGQSFGELPEYVRNSTSIVSGYSSAMVIDDLAIVWEYAAAVVAFLLGLAAAWYVTAAEPSRRRIGVLALWTAFAFFEFKESFQRHDMPHGELYFSAVLGGFLAFRFQAGRRLLGIGVLAALMVFALASQDWSFKPQSVIDPSANAGSAVRQLKEVFDAHELRRLTAQGRAGVMAEAGLDGKTLALLQGETVHVAPYETAWVWAYKLDWRPLPVFQSYSAYTTRLDRLNAGMVNSSRAPQRILLTKALGIDGRLLAFDQPLTEQAILCRYQELYATQSWDVLGAGPDRCGRPALISTVRAAWGQRVPVPVPPNDHTLIIARVGGVQTGWLERVGAALFKARERFVLIDGIRHRLVPGTAEDGLVLDARADIDFLAPFEVAPNATSIAVQLERDQPGGDPITYAFYAVPVRAGPRYPPLQQAILGNMPVGGATRKGAVAIQCGPSSPPCGPSGRERQGSGRGGLRQARSLARQGR
jgi:hypothetical protein